MIVVKVELWSALTGEKTELARAHISNIGGTAQKGDYHCQAFRGRDSAALDRHVVQKDGEVRGHPRLRQHIWNLVAKALAAMDYGQ